VEFPSKFIPIVPCWGFLDMVDGEEYFAGVVRFNRDSQRLHNVHKTAAIEAVAKAPKAPFITKLSWIKGFDKFWKSANSEDYPYLPIAEDADGIPQRAQQAELPAALLQLAALDNEDMRSQTVRREPWRAVQRVQRARYRPPQGAGCDGDVQLP
jgi:Phage P22-like portal protein